MIDPYFYDRLMHAFTTKNSTPLSRAAAPAATGRPTAETTIAATPCRAVRDAEDVLAAVLLRERRASEETYQLDDHSLPG